MCHFCVWKSSFFSFSSGLELYDNVGSFIFLCLHFVYVCIFCFFPHVEKNSRGLSYLTSDLLVQIVRLSQNIPSPESKLNSSSSDNHIQDPDNDPDSTSIDLTRWLPSNHPGYELFPNGFPTMDDLINNVKQVATKPLDCVRLRETQKKLQPYLTEASREWWENTLSTLEREDDDSCQTCRHLRQQQMSTCVSRTDDDETKKTKSQLNRQATKDLLLHLQEVMSEEQGSSISSTIHQRYPRSVLFPPSRYRWSNGSYVDTKMDSVGEFDEHDLSVLEGLANLCEPRESHFVGMSTKSISNRCGDKNPRPRELKVGTIVVVRCDNNDKSGLPFYVGEVLSFPDLTDYDFDNSPDTQIVICEYGHPPRKKKKDTDTDPGDIPWMAIFRGTENVKGVMKQRDEYRTEASNKPTTSAYKPLHRTIWMTSIAEFDTADKMLLKSSNNKSTGHRKLQKWVKKVLHNNPRVDWTLPDPKPRGDDVSKNHKRGRSTGDVPQRKRRKQ